MYYHKNGFLKTKRLMKIVKVQVKPELQEHVQES